MLILGILIGAVATVGITKSAHLVATDGHGRVPTRTNTHTFDLR
ncbi:hypothetical protein [Aeromicrobium fastidiosum]|nr:hypothetical protein [Aeromicrobium fastidiosum]MBP2389739.1 hypothetical protein [Aeromicrobium fastidiosum]